MKDSANKKIEIKYNIDSTSGTYLRNDAIEMLKHTIGLFLV